MDPILLALDTTDPLRALSAKKSGEENPSVKITHQRLTHRINKEHHRQNRTLLKKFFLFLLIKHKIIRNGTLHLRWSKLSANVPSVCWAMGRWSAARRSRNKGKTQISANKDRDMWPHSTHTLNTHLANTSCFYSSASRTQTPLLWDVLKKKQKPFTFNTDDVRRHASCALLINVYPI